MAWDAAYQDTFTIPSGVPANVPGYDSITFGTTLPAELAAYGYKAAIVFNHAAWTPTATVPQVKYYYIGVYHSSLANAIPSALDIGAVWVANASVNQTGVVVLMQNMFHDSGLATIGEGIEQAGSIAKQYVNLTSRLFVDSDKALIDYKASDIAYGKQACVNFTQGFQTTTAVGGQTPYSWVRRTITGHVSLQMYIGAPSVTGHICDLPPHGFYFPTDANLNVFGVTNANPPTPIPIRIQTDGGIYAVGTPNTFIYLNANWITL